MINNDKLLKNFFDEIHKNNINYVVWKNTLIFGKRKFRSLY